MQITSKKLSDTKISLSLSAGAKTLMPIKERALLRLGKDVKVPGFRAGKAPMHVIEKNISQQLLQSEVLQEAMDVLYGEALNSEKIRPISQPTATLKKFVPFTTIEFEAEVEILGTVKLPSYKSIKKSVGSVDVTSAEVNDVIENLRTRSASSKVVSRPAKDGDKLIIDFAGTDSKGQPVKGADGKAYPLVLGSKTFIPGFEENLLGTSAKEDKKFTVTFPKDYGVKALQNKNVTFAVTVNAVEEITKPSIDDAFAATVGPFKTVKELKADIKRQLLVEKQQQAKRTFDNELIKEISDKSKLSVPKQFVDEQIESLKTEINQNLMYRGITYKEMLENEGKTEEQYLSDVLRPEAEQRVKTGLVLAEIANIENIAVTPEELEIRLQILKGQYKDSAMQSELDKPEVIRDIESRLITEKTIAKLAEYASK